MTNFEINKRLAELLGNKNVLTTPAKNIDGDFIRCGNSVASYVENPHGVKRFFLFRLLQQPVRYVVCNC